MVIRNSALILVLSLVAVAAPQGAELYKVVDANGKVSYTQVPPAEKQKGAEVVSIKVAGDSASKVTKVGKYQFCGDLRLPYEWTSSYGTRSQVSFIDTLITKRKQWRKNLSKQQSLSAERSRRKFASSSARYVSSSQRRANASYHSDLRSDVEKMRDLRCAINWADNRIAGGYDKQTEHASETARLTKIRSKLQSRLDIKCGELPKFDPSDYKAKESRTRWYNCSKEYRADLEQVEKRIAQQAY